MTRRDHPVWRLLRIMVLCGTLLGLQLLTASSWDAELKGEAGALGGVTAMPCCLNGVVENHESFQGVEAVAQSRAAY